MNFSKGMRFLLGVLFLASAVRAGAEPGYTAAIQATPLARTTTTAGGDPIVYPKTESPEVTALLVEIPPGAETGWHRHPFPCYGYVLSGALTVELVGGRTLAYRAGDAVVEVVNRLHNGRNTGSDPVKLVLFVTGEKGQPFTVKAAAPK